LKPTDQELIIGNHQNQNNSGGSYRNENKAGRKQENNNDSGALNGN
jgi:hypothetical protein